MPPTPSDQDAETDVLAPDESETQSPEDYEAQMFNEKVKEVQSQEETPAPSLENSEFMDQLINQGGKLSLKSINTFVTKTYG